MNIPVIEHDLKHNPYLELVVEADGQGFTAVFEDASTGNRQDQRGFGYTVTAAIAALEIEIQKEGE